MYPPTDRFAVSRGVVDDSDVIDAVYDVRRLPGWSSIKGKVFSGTGISISASFFLYSNIERHFR
jgi:hypothetical protein